MNAEGQPNAYAASWRRLPRVDDASGHHVVRSRSVSLMRTAVAVLGPHDAAGRIIARAVIFDEHGAVEGIRQFRGEPYRSTSGKCDPSLGFSYMAENAEDPMPGFYK